MPVQSSGAISLNDLHVEAGGTSGTQCSLNDQDIRDMIGKASGATASLSEYYGASSTFDVNFHDDKSVTYNLWTHSDLNNNASTCQIDTGYMNSGWDSRMRTQTFDSATHYMLTNVTIDTRPGGNMRGKDIDVTYDVDFVLDQNHCYGYLKLIYAEVANTSSLYSGTNTTPTQSTSHISNLGDIDDAYGGTWGGTEGRSGTVTLTPPQLGSSDGILQLGISFRSREASGLSPQVGRWWNKLEVHQLELVEVP